MHVAEENAGGAARKPRTAKTGARRRQADDEPRDIGAPGDRGRELGRDPFRAVPIVVVPLRDDTRTAPTGRAVALRADARPAACARSGCAGSSGQRRRGLVAIVDDHELARRVVLALEVGGRRDATNSARSRVGTRCSVTSGGASRGTALRAPAWTQHAEREARGGAVSARPARNARRPHRGNAARSPRARRAAQAADCVLVRRLLASNAADSSRLAASRVNGARRYTYAARAQTRRSRRGPRDAAYSISQQGRARNPRRPPPIASITAPDREAEVGEAVERREHIPVAVGATLRPPPPVQGNLELGMPQRLRKSTELCIPAAIG